MSLNNTPRLYVGTYSKYNNGSIDGAWLDLDDFNDSAEFYEACQRLHADEADPEFMFQDFDGFPKELYSESGNIEAIYEYIDFCRDSYLAQDVIDAGLSLGIPLENIEEAYQGAYDSDEAFAQDLAESCGMIPANLSWPLYYIDWRAAARDLMQEYSCSVGHYFADNY